MRTKRTKRTLQASNAGVLIFLLLAGCSHREKPPLENLGGRQNLSYMNIQSVRGVRDGDRLAVQVLISDSSSVMTVDLHFAIGSPTTLASGTWRWSLPQDLVEGTVSARSVTFLGGQDGPPSIGGTFDLNAPAHPTYRLNLPLTVLPRSFRPATSSPQHP
jgi:hypothetical protein